MISCLCLLLTHTQTIIIAFLRDAGSIHGRPDPISLFALEGAGHETSPGDGWGSIRPSEPT